MLRSSPSSAEDAVPLGLVEPAHGRTVLLLGHERHGVDEGVWDLIDTVVEIPMLGVGSSLNVAVAGSLAAYRLAGLAQLADSEVPTGFEPVYEALQASA